MEKKINVYAYAKLKSTKIALTKDESYLLSRLINVENKVISQELPFEDIANEIYRCFEDSQVTLKADRVCISFLNPFSNRLNVMSSSNNEKLGINVMPRGYSCYIAPDSSVFKINESEMRICNNLGNVIESFNEQNRPVQRSLNNIYKMGIRSGLAMTSKIGNFGRGYLFLNSQSEDAYVHFSDSDYLILSVLKMVLNSILNRFFANFMVLENHFSKQLTEEQSFKGLFTVQDLCMFLQNNLFKYKRPNIQLKASTLMNDIFFIQEYTLLFIIEEALKQGQVEKDVQNLTLEFSHSEDRLKIQVYPGVQMLTLEAKNVELMAPLLGFSLVFRSEHFEITTNYFKASPTEIKNGYSV